MSVATSTALIIAGGVSAATSLASAKMQSNAAHNAARQQQQATNQALAVQQRVNQPYMDVGSAAAQRLGQMGANFQPYTQQFGGPGGSNGFQPFQGPPQGPPPGMPPGAGPQGPPPGSLAGMGRPPMGPGPQGAAMAGQGPQMAQGGAPAMAQGGAQGMMVKLQGPDGSVRDVPAAIAAQLIARGAQRVG
jgi:hypothetical protein